MKKSYVQEKDYEVIKNKISGLMIDGLKLKDIKLHKVERRKGRDVKEGIVLILIMIMNRDQRSGIQKLIQNSIKRMD